ncbi:MAG: hypothetical protein KKC03_13425 [Bacteroidetes bacterium]|nr:hypothetical protein [Bacteroidota bacterium]
MSSAKRRINSTNRRRIKREHIDIRMLESGPREPLKAKASLSLQEFGFPASAAVAIEAYHRSSGMRFDCGTIGSLSVPPVLILDEVDRSGSALFRVKVTDTETEPGKILGSAERIQPRSQDDSEGKRSLFPVVFRDLGEQVWKVEINYGDRPRLLLNKEIPGIQHRLHQNPLLQGLLLPAALRIVIEAIAGEPDDGDDDEPGWKEEWMQYCRSIGIQDDPADLDSEAKKEWVDRVVRVFCESYRFMAGIRKMEDAA